MHIWAELLSRERDWSYAIIVIKLWRSWNFFFYTNHQYVARLSIDINNIHIHRFSWWRWAYIHLQMHNRLCVYWWLTPFLPHYFSLALTWLMVYRTEKFKKLKAEMEKQCRKCKLQDDAIHFLIWLLLLSLDDALLLKVYWKYRRKVRSKQFFPGKILFLLAGIGFKQGQSNWLG